MSQLSVEALEYAKLLEKVKQKNQGAFRHIMGLIRIFTKPKK